MERRFNDQLRAHEDDENAHLGALDKSRHALIDRTIIPLQLAYEKLLKDHREDPNAHSLSLVSERLQLTTLWEERLEMRGQLRAVRRELGAAVAFLTLVITAAAVIVAVLK